MAQRQNRAKPQPKAGKSQTNKSSAAKTADLQTQVSLEEARHRQLCQLLEHTLHRHCDDYLRQLATTAVQVKTVAEIATMQAQLLKQQDEKPKARRKKKATNKNLILAPSLSRLFKQTLDT
jgi:hypothetical protein